MASEKLSSLAALPMNVFHDTAPALVSLVTKTSMSPLYGLSGVGEFGHVLVLVPVT